MTDKRKVTDAYLDEIFNAFNRQDVDAIVSCFAEDGFFRTARGEGAEGTTLQGRDAIRHFLTARWKQIPDLRWEGAVNRRCGEHFAVSQWRVLGTMPDGEQIDWLGCDLYEFDDDGMIMRKDTYWKGPIA